MTAALPLADSDIVEVSQDLSASRFYNAGIAPTGRSQRKWGTFDIAALWISMSACIPTYMLASSRIGEGMNWWEAVAVTSATIVIYGHAIWDPVDLLTRFQNPAVLLLAMIALCVATLATNIAANVVLPANDFPHLAPRFINVGTGGLITGIIGILMQPWKLLADPSGYIFTWLVAYSALLGPVGGILIVDYFFVRREKLDLAGLFSETGPYWYQAGFNRRALLALSAGIAPCAPGFLGTVGLMRVGAGWLRLYDFAWFVSLGIAGLLYLLLMLPNRQEPDASTN